MTWEHRSDRANEVAQNTVKNPHLVDSDSGDTGGGDTGGGDTGDTGGDTPLADIAYDFTGGAEFLYYYHPDHLGSTGFVTDKKGELYEHIEYFPFGETWVLEGASNWKVPYMYTSKELDADTQLYYYGARYYDPRTSVWQSADPILVKYLPTGNKASDSNLSGMGGVFNTLNLSMYSYAGLNPIKYTDPDGKQLVKVTPGKTSAFNKPFLVDQSYLPVIVAMNEIAKDRGIKIKVQQKLRIHGVKVKGAIVTPAIKSKHLVGRASDLNFVDKDGKYYNSKKLTKKNMSANIKGFVDDLLKVKASSKFDKKESPRWGGNFGKKDSVHFDMPTSKKTWNKLFKENQQQYKTNKGIGSMKLD